MQKQDLKNLLENIYHLLAEDAPPPTAEEPRGTVQPRYAPGMSPQERTLWWDYNQWFADHGQSGEIIGMPGPWNGTWEHPNFGTVYSLFPTEIPGPHQGVGWTGWRDGKPHEYPLPEGVKPGTGQWVMTLYPQYDIFYIVPQGNTGTYAAWVWVGMPGANSYFEQQKPWGYRS